MVNSIKITKQVDLGLDDILNGISELDTKDLEKFMQKTTGVYKVTMETNYGNIVLELDAKTTPITAGSFAENAKNGYYSKLYQKEFVA